MDGEAVVIDLKGRRVMGLTPSASLLWTSADGKRTVGEMARLLVQRFGIPVATAERDTADFLAQMAARGLIELH